MKCTLEELHNLYKQNMYRVAYAILHDEARAEDVVQEAFVKIFRNLEQVKDVNSLETKCWVLRIVKNEAIDCYRKTKREWELNNTISAEPLRREYDNVEDEIQQSINKEEVQKILDELPAQSKEILKCRVFYELSTKETADMLGVPEETVRKRFARAKQKFRELAGGNDNEK